MCHHIYAFPEKIADLLREVSVQLLLQHLDSSNPLIQRHVLHCIYALATSDIRPQIPKFSNSTLFDRLSSVNTQMDGNSSTEEHKENTMFVINQDTVTVLNAFLCREPIDSIARRICQKILTISGTPCIDLTEPKSKRKKLEYLNSRCQICQIRQ